MAGHKAAFAPGQRVRTTPTALASRRFGTHCTGTVVQAPRHGRTVLVRLDGREVASRWPAGFWRVLGDGETLPEPRGVAEPDYPAKRRRRPLTLDEVAALVAGVLRDSPGMRCVEIAEALDGRVPFARSRIHSALRARPELFARVVGGGPTVWRLRGESV